MTRSPGLLAIAAGGLLCAACAADSEPLTINNAGGSTSPTIKDPTTTIGGGSGGFESVNTQGGTSGQGTGGTGAASVTAGAGGVGAANAGGAAGVAGATVGGAGGGLPQPGGGAGGAAAGAASDPGGAGVATGGTDVDDTADDMADDEGGDDAPMGDPNGEPIVPIDEDLWFASTSNLYGFTGAWYCFDDGVEATDCTDDAPVFDPAVPAVCLSGTTVVDPDYKAWGAGIGVALNDDDGTKLAFDADAAGISGFSFTVTGTIGAAPLKFKIPQTTSDSEEAPPEYEITDAGSYTVDFTDVTVPSWAAKADETPNTDAIYELKFQIAGGDAASDYDFCISDLQAF